MGHFSAFPRRSISSPTARNFRTTLARGGTPSVSSHIRSATLYAVSSSRCGIFESFSHRVPSSLGSKRASERVDRYFDICRLVLTLHFSALAFAFAFSTANLRALRGRTFQNARAAGPRPTGRRCFDVIAKPGLLCKPCRPWNRFSPSCRGVNSRKL